MSYRSKGSQGFTMTSSCLAMVSNGSRMCVWMMEDERYNRWCGASNFQNSISVAPGITKTLLSQTCSYRFSSRLFLNICMVLYVHVLPYHSQMPESFVTALISQRQDRPLHITLTPSHVSHHTITPPPQFLCTHNTSSLSHIETKIRRTQDGILTRSNLLPTLARVGAGRRPSCCRNAHDNGRIGGIGSSAEERAQSA